MKTRTVAIAALCTVLLNFAGNAVHATPAIAQASNAEATCGAGLSVATYETRNFWIYICRQGQGFRYVGVNKTTDDSLSRPAQRTESGYRAVNGNFTYLIDRQDLLILENGLLFSREPVLNVWYSNISQGQQGILTARDANAQINLRAYPNPNSRSLGYGLVGDRVSILEQAAGTDGYRWYRVRFPRSGAVGWIRGDLIRVVQ